MSKKTSIKGLQDLVSAQVYKRRDEKENTDSASSSPQADGSSKVLSAKAGWRWKFNLNFRTARRPESEGLSQHGGSYWIKFPKDN